MRVRIEIECPYCNKIHVHDLEGLMFIPAPTPKEEEKELPSDPDTEDLENFREEA